MMQTSRTSLLRLFITALVLMGVLWLLSIMPTTSARYVWEQYRVGHIALLLNRSDAELAYRIGSYYFGNQGRVATDEKPYDLEIAKKAFEKAVAINPNQQYAHYSLARIAFVQTRYVDALEHIENELALYPENKRPLYIRALIYTYRGLEGDLERAEEDFAEFVAWAPNEWAGYNDLAYVLAKQGKFADAEDVLRKGIATARGGETNPWLWNTLGVMQLNRGAPSVALNSFKNAQAYASALIDNDWLAAYPGNNPSLAVSGLGSFRRGIEANMRVAQQAIRK